MKHTIRELISDTVSNIRIYINSKLDLYLLSTLERLGKFQADLIYAIVLLFISLFFIFFLTFAAAVWLGVLLGSYIYGFLIISGFYLLLGLIVVLFKDAIIDRPIIRNIMKSYCDKKKKIEL